jgi:hypothetical protein
MIPLAERTNVAVQFVPSNALVAAGVAVIPVPPPAMATLDAIPLAKATATTARSAVFFIEPP